MDGFVGLSIGVIGLGLLHGVLPDHGWPIAATYALGRSSRWISGVIAGLVIGLGHLASSIALVLVFLWLGSRVDLLGSAWLGYVAGTLLILLGVYEYRHGGHDHGSDQDHHHDHGSDQDHDHGDEHESEHESGHFGRGDADEQGLRGLAVVAIALGVAHEEPIQILAICAGTPYCLELMIIYSLAVIVAILVPTLLLISGYERHRDTVEHYLPYLSTVTAAILVGMGLLFIVGVF